MDKYTDKQMESFLNESEIDMNNNNNNNNNNKNMIDNNDGGDTEYNVNYTPDDLDVNLTTEPVGRSTFRQRTPKKKVEASSSTTVASTSSSKKDKKKREVAVNKENDTNTNTIPIANKKIDKAASKKQKEKDSTIDDGVKSHRYKPATKSLRESSLSSKKKTLKDKLSSSSSNTTKSKSFTQLIDDDNNDELKDKLEQVIATTIEKKMSKYIENNNHINNINSNRKANVDDGIHIDTVNPTEIGYARVIKSPNGRYSILNIVNEQYFDSMEMTEMKKRVFNEPIFDRKVSDSNPLIGKVILDYITNKFCRLRFSNDYLKEKFDKGDLNFVELYASNDYLTRKQGTKGKITKVNSKDLKTYNTHNLKQMEDYNEEFKEAIIEADRTKYYDFLKKKTGYDFPKRGSRKKDVQQQQQSSSSMNIVTTKTNETQ